MSLTQGSFKMTALDLYHHLIAQGFRLSVNGGNLRLSPFSKLTDELRTNIKNHKSELMALLAANDNLELIKNRYQHLICCQHCEHLAVNTYCKISGVKMYPNAMRDCAIFKKVEGDRLPIVHVPYSQSELNDLRMQKENSLLTHLVQCQTCQVGRHDYCADANVIGGEYEAMLLCFEDAERRHDTFMTKVTKVRLSSGKPLVRLVQQTKVRGSHDE
jgi:hypothetical protein